MTRDEAKKVLRDSGYCEKHGCELVEKDNVNPFANAAYGKPRVCPLCETEASLARKQRVDEAKKVLGL